MYHYTEIAHTEIFPTLPFSPSLNDFTIARPFEQLTKQMQLSQSELSSMSLPQPPPAQGKTVSRQDINAIQTFPLRK